MNGRSYLYVPGDQPAKLERALDRGADALILDLEDGVAFTAKPEARRLVSEWLGELWTRQSERPVERSPEVWVRINPIGPGGDDALAADLDAAVSPALTGLCLAKCDSPAEVSELADAITEHEKRLGLQAFSVRISALIESASGLFDAPRIAKERRVSQLQLGEADLSAELGVSPGLDETELLPFRAQVVLASAVAGLDGPIAPVSPNFRDLDRFRSGTERLKRLGFIARAVIHPAQIPIVNEVFTPSQSEEAAARSIVELFEAALAKGEGVVLDEHGRMVDEAVVRSARRVILQAERGRSEAQ